MNTSILAYLDQDPIFISFSSRSLAHFCWRKFEFYKMMLNPQRNYMDTLAAEAGKCIHEAHQEWMRTRDADAATYKLIETYPVKNNAELHLPTGYRSLESCLATLDALIQAPKLNMFELANVHCLDGVERPAIEVPFDIILKDVYINNRPVVYTGFIDYIFWSIVSGEYTTADLKTTRDTSGDVMTKYKFHAQCAPYGLVLQHILGANVNSFQVMYIHTYLDLLEPRVAPLTLPKGPAEVEDWYTGLIFFVRQWLEYETSNWYPRRESGCENQFREKCRYLDICDERARDRAQIYILSEQDPMVEEHPVPWIAFELDMPDNLKRAA